MSEAVQRPTIHYPDSGRAEDLAAWLSDRMDQPVSRGFVQDMQRFEAALTARNQVMNLVGPATLPEFWGRHVLDSLQLIHHRPEVRVWADLGAGAGFPGIVLASWLGSVFRADSVWPPLVYLIDSSHKRCQFLQEVVEMLNLPARVICARAEAVDAPRLDPKPQVVTARAVAALDKLLGFAEAYMRAGAEAWFLKGETVAEEIKTAQAHWRFDAKCFASLSDPRGQVVHVRGLKHVQ